MTKPIINIQSLTKNYADKTILNNLNWAIQPGEIVALLGHNGAGKTTLLESIMNLKTATSGEVNIFDNTWQTLTAKQRQKIAFVAQDTHGFDWMSISAYLNYLGSFYDQWNASYATQLCQKWRLDPSKVISALSGGQRQVLRIVQALSTQPDVLILDEPVAHLDPNMRRSFLTELAELCADNGTTVIFSSHIISDLERIASRVALLNNGTIACDYPLDELKEGIGQIRLTSKDPQIDIKTLPLEMISDAVITDSSAFGKLLSPITEQSMQQWQAMGLEIELLPISLEDWYLAMTHHGEFDA
ncbi:ABC transporter ATP-binding protein [Thalassotalea ganghwensis]